MMNGRLDLAIGRTAVALSFGLVALSIAVGIAASPYFRATVGLDRGLTSGYTRGDTIDVPSAAYRGVARTVVVFSRSSCPACQAARPRLRRLTAAVKRVSDARIVLVTPLGDESNELVYARDLGLAESEVMAISPSQVRVRAVPTIALVDSQGRIIFVHEGPTGDDDDLEIERLLTLPAGR